MLQRVCLSWELPVWLVGNSNFNCTHPGRGLKGILSILCMLLSISIVCCIDVTWSRYVYTTFGWLWFIIFVYIYILHIYNTYISYISLLLLFTGLPDECISIFHLIPYPFIHWNHGWTKPHCASRSLQKLHQSYLTSWACLRVLCWSGRALSMFPIKFQYYSNTVK